ncbi:MAG: hypothetical protein JSR18_01985 [Proteobacteria bacterium]|nr:hypothetical protein [Pseudomonadota bacterium]
MARWILVALCVLSLYGAYDWWTQRPVTTPAGVQAAADPVQVNVVERETHIAAGHTLVVRAHYDITARILRKERYRADATADIAPWDLAVGWGPMSDAAIVDQLDITQMGRFFYWRMRDPVTFPLKPQDLVVHAGQIHAIPGDAAVASRLAHLRPGSVVTLRGDLVDVQMDGGVWATSLTRVDTGAGACEIMWIRAVN